MKKIVCFYFCCLVMFSSALPADDDDDDAKKTSTASLHSQKNLVMVDKATQIAAGLKVLSVKAVSERTELVSYGVAVSVEPLLAAQNQYLNALAQQRSTQARLSFSQSNVSRQAYLHKEGIVSSRVLQDLQATLQTEKAALESGQYLAQQIISNARLVWGDTLTNGLIKADSTFSALVQQRHTLLKITLPLQISKNAALKTIYVAPSAHRDLAMPAQLISVAPQTDSFSQGQQYFYQISSKLIKAGMRVSAWLPTEQHQQTGVIIPESALIWHLGEALIFVKVAQQQFAARELKAYHKTVGGYFVSEGVKAGEQVVITGAQMLLSQQFKGQIPSEDDD